MKPNQPKPTPRSSVRRRPSRMTASAALLMACLGGTGCSGALLLDATPPPAALPDTHQEAASPDSTTETPSASPTSAPDEAPSSSPSATAAPGGDGEITASATPGPQSTEGATSPTPALTPTSGHVPMEPDGAETSEGTETLPDATPVEPPLPEPDEITGVLVVGAGPAGLSAALELESAGIPTLLMEQASDTGGTGRWAGGMMLFAGTPLQASSGIQDSPEQLLSEWPSFTGGDSTSPWLIQWAHQQVESVYSWLAGMGIRFLRVELLADSGTTPRIHVIEGGGANLVDVLSARIPPAALRLNTRALALVSRGGKVLGVEFERVDTGQRGWIQAESVILATGGFMRNLEQVRQVRPELQDIDLWFSAGPDALGDGLRLTAPLQADAVNLPAASLYAHGIHDYRQPGKWEELSATNLQNTLWINADGVRFTNEAAVGSYSAGEAVIDQPAGIAWSLFDATIASTIQLGDPLRLPDDLPGTLSVEEAVADNPYGVKANTLEELASAIQVPFESLQASLKAYLDNPAMDEFGKGDGAIQPIQQPPFYALRIVPVTAKAFGGLRVDLAGRVLNTAGVSIGGLYAAGELTGMAGGTLVGDRGFTGSLSAVIYSGRVAGRSAATALQDLRLSGVSLRMGE